MSRKRTHTYRITFREVVQFNGAREKGVFMHLGRVSAARCGYVQLARAGLLENVSSSYSGTREPKEGEP